MFLSIHLNKFSDAQYHGAQVFYSTGNVQGKPLAEQIQQCLIDGCDPLNHRKAKQADSAIYLRKSWTARRLSSNAAFCPIRPKKRGCGTKPITNNLLPP